MSIFKCIEAPRNGRSRPVFPISCPLKNSEAHFLFYDFKNLLLFFKLKLRCQTTCCSKMFLYYSKKKFEFTLPPCVLVESNFDANGELPSLPRNVRSKVTTPAREEV